MQRKRIYTIVAIPLVISLLVPLFWIPQGPSYGDGKQPDTVGMAGDNERIAAEISNLTGVESERILELKSTGISWNEVIDILQGGSSSGRSERERRAEILARTGLGEEAVEQLKKEGFGSEEITEARMLAERVQFQLRQIAETAGPPTPVPTAEPEAGKEQENEEMYLELSQSFLVEDAVYFILKLEEAFETKEAALNEYLLSLQLGLDLFLYFEDKEKYLKAKEEKMLGRMPGEMITAARIEEKALEAISKEAPRNEGPAVQGSQTEHDPSLIEAADDPPLPVLRFRIARISGRQTRRRRSRPKFAS